MAAVDDMSRWYPGSPVTKLSTKIQLYRANNTNKTQRKRTKDVRTNEKWSCGHNDTHTVCDIGTYTNWNIPSYSAKNPQIRREPKENTQRMFELRLSTTVPMKNHTVCSKYFFHTNAAIKNICLSGTHATNNTHHMEIYPPPCRIPAKYS